MIDPATLDDYVGVYQLTSRVNLIVTREADRLFVAFGAQPAMPVFPESDGKFFWEKIACQISFARPAGPGHSRDSAPDGPADSDRPDHGG